MENPLAHSRLHSQPELSPSTSLPSISSELLLFVLSTFTFIRSHIPPPPPYLLKSPNSCGFRATELIATVRLGFGTCGLCLLVSVEFAPSSVTVAKVSSSV